VSGALVAIYLAAVVAANLLVAQFGPGFSIVNAFLFIGLDLTTRDLLHDRWKNRLWAKMALLVATGSLLSWLLNREAGQIALASAVAFGLSGAVDFALYHLLRNRSWAERVNLSNTGAALVDSLVFPTLAFGGFLPLVTLGQFAAKVGGGAVWAVILAGTRHERVGDLETA
jgi:uncharacterized PurR-regulated membrane protein YhhQ (DUF165 family)